MKHVFKLVLATVVLTLSLNYSFGQLTIYIKSGDTGNGNLDLSDNGYSRVDQFTRITWTIKPGSNVKSIKSVHREKGSPSLFFLGPSKTGNNWTGKVVFAPKSDYSYYITWTADSKGNAYTYDPKIAVNPKLNLLEILGTILAIIAVAFLGIRYVRIRNRAAK